MWIRVLAAALLVVAGLSSAGHAQQKRVALVIGNAAYRQNELRNPVNDARAMAATLRQAGFQVIQRENATKQQMEQAVGEFGRALKPGSVALFYYAGHGMQVNGRNFLVPVDAEVATEQSVRLETLDVDLVLDQVAAAGSDVNLMILDACRNNPFERRFRSAGTGGLAQINAPKGTLIAYATAPGKVAADGEGNNGIYTARLVQAIKTPGLSVEEMFKRVRAEVSRETNDLQTPWEASSLVGNFYFLGPTTVTVTPPAQPGAPGPVDREALHWQSVKDATNPAEVQSYLDQYPKGAFAGLARARLATLQKPPASAPAAKLAAQQAAAPTPGAAQAAKAFDGTWQTTVICGRAADGAKGYTLNFPAEVKDGVFIGQFASPNTPASLTVNGTIQADGSALLSAVGRTGDEEYAIGRLQKGSNYRYTVTARFDGARGSGTRNEARACNLTFVRQ
ncbi:MAG: caspase family protein [Alphaproteobacteria bacterium]|nr:caspase family protein [Alphaproteobacteria bacterium]